jgi:hypothetical protein
MNTLWQLVQSWDRSISNVTRLCFTASAGCFVAGGILLALDLLVPVGPRGIALLPVGCFFLAHGLYELAKERWHAAIEIRPRAIVQRKMRQEDAA